jgi:DNA-binding MarR family transcriptional regulator
MSTPSKIQEDVSYLGRELGARTVMFHEAVAQRMGLSASEHKCLDLLIRAGGPLTAGQLAELTGLTTGAITGIVDRLEEAGYVRRERVKSDRRKVLIHPQPPLQEEIVGIFNDLGQAVQEAVMRYDDQQLAVIRDFLVRMIQVMVDQTAQMKENLSRKPVP